MTHPSIGHAVLDEAQTPDAVGARSPISVSDSIAYCHQMTRDSARNFYYGLRLTPEPKRSALYVVYAFMRACDDLVDEPTTPHAQPSGARGCHEPTQERLARIERFRRQMQRVLIRREGFDAEGEDPLLAGRADSWANIWPGFRHVMQQYPINPDDLHAMLDGQRCDVLQTRYETFEQLYGYCYKVASVVGLVCISVWGYTGDESTRKLAEARGVALQLTNILRDVVEDAGRDRVYLPSEDLRSHGLNPDEFTDHLLTGRVDARFDQMIMAQVDRARRYYEQSADLERYLDPTCRATSWAMMRIYRGLLERIARSPRRLLRGRVRLHAIEKIGIALCALRWRVWRRG